MKLERRLRRTIPWLTAEAGRFEFRAGVDSSSPSPFVRIERATGDIKRLDTENNDPDAEDDPRGVVERLFDARVDTGETIVLRNEARVENVDPPRSVPLQRPESRREALRRELARVELNYSGSGPIHDWVDLFTTEDDAHVAGVDNGGTIQVFDRASGRLVASDHRDDKFLFRLDALRWAVTAAAILLVCLSLRSADPRWAWFESAVACVAAVAIAWLHRNSWNAFDSVVYPSPVWTHHRFPQCLSVDPRGAFAAGMYASCFLPGKWSTRGLAIAFLVFATMATQTSMDQAIQYAALASVVIVGAIANVGGVTIEPEGSTDPSKTSRWQWSLVDLIVWTTAAAVLVASATTFAERNTWWPMWFRWLWMTRLAFAAPLMVAAMFSRTWLARVIFTAMAIASMAAGVLIDYSRLPWRNNWTPDILRWGKLTLDCVVTTIVVLLPFFLRGYRWVWRPWWRTHPTPDAPASS